MHHFAFGGGLRNGGLPDEWRGSLAEFVDCDYMGAAEYEFGALPDAIRRLLVRTDVLYFRSTVEIGKGKSKREFTFHGIGPDEFKHDIHATWFAVCSKKQAI